MLELPGIGALCGLTQTLAIARINNTYHKEAGRKRKGARAPCIRRRSEGQDVLEEEMRKMDECDMEKFGTLDSSEKTIAILGDTW